MTTQLPPPGWYADPGGKPGQMYWDGQRWQQAIPATTSPAAAPTPWDKLRPHVDKARPQLDKGRRFWSGQSRERKVILALAGLLVVVAVIAVPVAAFDYLFAGPDPNSPQALCDAVHDKGAQGGVEWYLGRQAAGDTRVQMMAVRDQAYALCPDDIKSILAQLPH